MTREEAIKIIDCYDIGFYDLSGEKIPADKLADAFDMAIEALRTAEINCVHCPRYHETEDETGVHGHCDTDRPHGEWVEVVELTEQYDREGVKTWATLYQCSNCGFVLNAIEGHIGQYDFCPNCGADMRKDGEA